MTDDTRSTGGEGLTDPAALLAVGWQETAGSDGFFTLVGPFWHKDEGDRFSLGFFVSAKHANRNGVVHGGMLASLADTAMGLAARRHDLTRLQATIQLGIHYIAASHLGEFAVAHCTIRRSTRSVSFVDAEIFSGSRLVATAQGIWKTLDARPKLTGDARP